MTSKTTHKHELAPGITATDAEVAAAKKEGALDYVKEGAGRAVAADTGTTGEPDAKAEAKRAPADINTTQIAPLLDLSIEQLSRRLANDKVPDPIDLRTAQGLLVLERSGRNRTDYVKALCERIGDLVGDKVESPYEVTHAGPGYTNDVSAVTAL